jgi:choline dehydrogenase
MQRWPDSGIEGAGVRHAGELMTQLPKSFGEFDYVIAGGGTAGCVLANRLSADPDVTVLLLEAGGKDDWIWIHIPIGYLKCINNPRTDWCYKTEAEPGLNGRSIIYARGKVLGGCSSINGMLYLRGQVRDYEEWAQITGDARWNWDSVLPVFKRSEDYWGGADEMHGEQGEWRVEKQRLHWDILDRYTQAAQEAGIPFKAGLQPRRQFRHRPLRGEPEEGRALECVEGHAAAGAAPPESEGRHRRADRQAGHGGQGGARRRVQPRRCATQGHGAHRDPADGGRHRLAGHPAALGHRPGGNLLQNRGIPLLHESPGVGGNLQDHLQLRMIFKVHGIKTLNQRANSLWGKAMMGLEYALFRSGPLSMAPSQLGGFFHSSPEVATPDLEFHVQPLSLEKFGDPLHPFPAFTASVCNLRPTSRGVVHIRDRDPATAPVIAPNYLSTDNDRQVAARALRLTRNIVAQPAMAPYRPEEHQPGAQKQTRRGTGEGRRRHRHHDLPPDLHLRHGSQRTTRTRWSIQSCGCGASVACAWSMPRSCRPSPRATPTRRR